MRTWHRSCLALLAMVLAGCLPEERFWWSPDGSRAVVLVDDTLHLVTAGGALGEPLLAGLDLSKDLPKRAAWLPDGRGFVINRVRNLPAWEEVRALVSPAEVEEVERLARSFPRLVEAALSLAEDAGSLGDLFAPLQFKEKTLLALAARCAYQQQAPALEAALLKATHGPALVKELREEPVSFVVHEICLVRLRGDAADGPPQALVRSLQPLAFPAVSPHGSAVAYVRFLEKEETAALEVVTLDGKSRVEVARGVSGAFAWTPEGRSLVFDVPLAGDDQLLKRLQKVTVVDEAGGLLGPRADVQPDGALRPVKDAPAFPAAVDLALAILPSSPRLLCLPDDRVLFAAQPVTLPAAGPGPEPAPCLYLASADGKTLERVPTNPGDLPTDLGYFAVSPDGASVAVVESGTDAVAVVTLATGKTQIVSPAHPRWHCETIPAWKSPTELTFAALSGPGQRPRWVVWTAEAGVRPLSEAWPEGATSKWLTEKKDETSGKEEAGRPGGAP